MSDAAGQHREPQVERRVGSLPRFVAGAVLVAALLVGAAVWMTGPAPRSADEGFPKEPPPLVLPTGTPDDAPVARAAAQLATGDLDRARAGFVDVVAEDADDEVGQVGLVLARWRSTGPLSVERDLRPLTLEYPESPLVAFHLGLVQTLLGEPRAARESLREALRLGRASTDPTSLRIATLADDLLHPDGFRGSMPVLVRLADVPAADRPAVTRLLAAISVDDRRTAGIVGAELQRSDDGLAQVAGIAATFSKDDPDAVAERLDALAGDASLDRAARDRAALHATLARLWTGTGRDAGCAGLAAADAPGVDAGTRRLAGPIRTELCG